MGWWKIVDVKTGKIDWEFKSGSNLINATVDNAFDELVIGDQPADIMDEAIDNIVGIYKEYWGRKPQKQELMAIFNFCTGWRTDEYHKNIEEDTDDSRKVTNDSQR